MNRLRCKVTLHHETLCNATKICMKSTVQIKKHKQKKFNKLAAFQNVGLN